MNPRKLLAWAAHDWPAKVLSLALALFLFIFHRFDTLEGRFFSVPLNIEVQGSMMPASSYPRVARISLRGDRAAIQAILEDDIEAYADFTSYDTLGTYRAPVEYRKKGTALGVEPLEVQVEPVEISVSLDHKISKSVPLRANIRGQVEQGYTLSSYSLNPTQVVIDGPSVLMGSITELPTYDIDLNGRTGDFSVMVNINNEYPLIVIRGSGAAEFRGFVSKLPAEPDLEPAEEAE